MEFNFVILRKNQETAKFSFQKISDNKVIFLAH